MMPIRNLISALVLPLAISLSPWAAPDALANSRATGVARDKHGHIARSAHAKTEFRHSHPCPATGKTRGACPGYVIDHVVPLKRGGRDAASNMQWQTTAEAKAKDRWE